MLNSYYDRPAKHIYSYFGYGTDCYVDETLQVWTQKQMLHRELKLHGYERVVFVGLNEGLYFMDGESFALLHGRKQDDGKQKRTPLSMTRRSIVPKEEEQQDWHITVNYQEMLSYTQKYLQDVRIKTAVVIDNARTLLTTLKGNTQEGQLDDYFQKINGISHVKNDNVLLLLFNQGCGEVQEFLEEKNHKDIWEILKDKTEMHIIKAPNAEEIRLLCHHQRLVGYDGKRLRVDLTALDSMSRMLASKIMRNRSLTPEEEKDKKWADRELQAKELKELEKHLWNEFIREGRKLDLDTCRKMCADDQKKPPLERLDELIGMDAVKDMIHRFVDNYAGCGWAGQKTGLRLEKPRVQDGDGKNKPDLHMILTGRPGTGKTTAARLFGEIYAELGLLPSGHLVEVRPGDLIGQHIGDSEANMRKAIDRARGGILFIDEAYGLNPKIEGGQEDPYRKGMLEVLVGSITAKNADFAVVMAGYPDDMQRMLKANEGMNSRFGIQIHIEDYTDEELKKIFHLEARKQGCQVSEELDGELLRLIAGYHVDKEDWGNAREMEKLVNHMKENAKETGSCLKPEHIPEDLRHYITGEREADAEARLNEMIGLQEVKNSVRRYKNRAKLGKNDKKTLDHFIFVGNPGTGKTTVANLFGLILKQQGILRSGKVNVVEPKDLRTVEDLVKEIKRSQNRVLFIDEAYKVLHRKDLLDILIEYTNPDKIEFPFCLVCAGYVKEMEEFLEANIGGDRRFKPVYFENYSADELLQIMDLVIRKDYPDYAVTEGFRAESLRHFRTYENQIGDRYNGGYIKRYLDKVTDILYEQLLAKYEKKENVPPEAYAFTEDVVPRNFCGRMTRGSISVELS